MDIQCFYQDKWCFIHFINGNRTEEHYDSPEDAHTRMMQYYHDFIVSDAGNPNGLRANYGDRFFHYQQKDGFESGYLIKKKVLCRKRNYQVLQLKENENRRKLAWLPFDEVEGGPKLENYRSVYSKTVTEEQECPDNDLLETIFSFCQSCKDKNYQGHSLSVSDVVLLDGKPYYCDSYGWQAF